MGDDDDRKSVTIRALWNEILNKIIQMKLKHHLSAHCAWHRHFAQTKRFGNLLWLCHTFGLCVHCIETDKTLEWPPLAATIYHKLQKFHRQFFTSESCELHGGHVQPIQLLISILLPTMTTVDQFIHLFSSSNFVCLFVRVNFLLCGQCELTTIRYVWFVCFSRCGRTRRLSFE